MIRPIDVDNLLDDPNLVAAGIAGKAIFGLLSRSVRVPQQFCAVTSRAGGKSNYFPAGREVEGDDATLVLFLRETPFDVPLSIDALTAGDGYLCDAWLGLQLRVPPERSDRDAFRDKVLGSRERVDVAAIAALLRPPVETALRDIAGRYGAAELTDGKCHAECIAAINEALKEVCFTSGLALEAPVHLRIESTEYDRVRHARQRAARKLDEHQAQQSLNQAIAEAQTARLGHLETMLARLKDLADRSPGLGLPELMRAFEETQRGQLYQALLQTGSRQRVTQWIVIAAGDQLHFYDPAATGAAGRTITLQGPVGALRSVQLGADGSDPVLLVGAATGAYEVPLATGGAADAATDAPGDAKRTYTMDEQESVRGGFNAVTADGEFIAASHSELGLIAWRRSQPGKPVRLLPDQTASADAVRGAQFADGALWCAIDDRVVALPVESIAAAARGETMPTAPRNYTGCRSTITALVVTPAGAFAGTADGQVLVWDIDGCNAPRVLHRGSRRAVESIHHVASGGVARLFFTDTSLAVIARVIGDTVSSRYEAGGQTLRRVEVASDVLAATTDARDRVIVFSAAAPSDPAAVIPVLQQTQRSIQDVVLVPLPAAAT